MVNRLHYVCHLRLANSDRFVVWYQDDPDGFVQRPDGFLLQADSVESIGLKAAGMGIPLVRDNITKYDFDRLRAWCCEPTAEEVECPAFVNSWNFFDDLAGLHARPDSSYGRFSRRAVRSYDKLFWGNNLPSVTPPGERFVPSWTPEELDEIRRVMEAGLTLLESDLQQSATSSD